MSEIFRLTDIHYIAGLLEGEGSFCYSHNSGIRISIEMIDSDTIDKIKNIMSPSTRIGIYNHDLKSNKEKYHFIVSGQLAIEWMMTLYSLMSSRRKARIKEIINIWMSNGIGDRHHKCSQTYRRKALREDNIARARMRIQ